MTANGTEPPDFDVRPLPSGWPKMQSVYIIDLVAQSHRHKIE
jgi:hypothetical protein